MSKRYSIREQFTKDISELTLWCYIKGYAVTDGEAYRTVEQQAIHIKKGLSKVKVSQHQKRLARNLHIWQGPSSNQYITNTQWREVGKKWESMNPKNKWGGFWKNFYDPSHYERRS